MDRSWPLNFPVLKEQIVQKAFSYCPQRQKNVGTTKINIGTIIFFEGLEKLKAFAQWPKTTLMATKKLTRKWDMEKLLQ